MGRGQFRCRESVRALFGGLDLVEPGLVPVPDWWPDAGTPTVADNPVLALAGAGVARKP